MLSECATAQQMVDAVCGQITGNISAQILRHRNFRCMCRDHLSEGFISTSVKVDSTQAVQTTEKTAKNSF